jgi:hypothetical protein
VAEVALTRRIGACASWTELQLLLDSQEPHLNRVHLAAMLTRLAAVAPVAHVPRAELAEHHALQRTLLAMAQANLQRLGPRELVSILSALPALQLRPDRPLACRLMAACLARMHHFDCLAAIHLASALAKLGMRMRADFAAGYQARVAQLLGGMHGRGLAVVLYGQAAVGAPPPADAWLQAYGAALLRERRGLQTRDLANVVWALAKLRPGAGACEALAWLPQLLQHCQPLLPACRPEELSSLVWGLAKLGLQPSAPWMRAFLAASAAAFGAASAQSLSATLYALALLQWRPPEGWMQGQRRALAAALPQCSSQALAVTVYALALLRQRPPLPWLRQLLRQAHALRSSGLLQPRSEEMLLEALDLLGLPAEWQQAGREQRQVGRQQGEQQRQRRPLHQPQHEQQQVAEAAAAAAKARRKPHRGSGSSTQPGGRAQQRQQQQQQGHAGVGAAGAQVQLGALEEHQQLRQAQAEQEPAGPAAPAKQQRRSLVIMV